MSKTKKPVDSAVATIARSTTTDVLKVTVTHEIAAAMPQSSLWATSPTLQAACKAWDGDATAIDAQAKVVAGLRAQLKTAVATQLSLRRNWQVSKAQVLSIATGVCGGSADQVKTLSLDVASYRRLGLLPAPTGLAVTPGSLNGEVQAEWTRGLAARGFVVQHATNPADPATISAAIVCTKHKLVLAGMPVGAALSFRVAAIDPAAASGQSPWSSWVVGNAR
jgi:hypothetical protein